MGICILFLGIYRIKPLTKYLSQHRHLRRTPLHAPYHHYFILHFKRKGKNNISLQTLSIMYLYKENVRIVYDIFPYAHFPQQPVVLLTVWFGYLCFLQLTFVVFSRTLSFPCIMFVFLFHTIQRAQVPCIFIHSVNGLDYKRDAVSLSVKNIDRKCYLKL